MMRKEFLHGLRKQEGFTMIEMILALLASSLCAILMSYLVQALRLQDVKTYTVEDHTAIMQLQLLFAQAQRYDIAHQGVKLRYHAEDTSLTLYQDKLVKQPGFEVYMQNIEHLSFYEEGRCIRLTWRRKGKEHDAIIGCQ